MLDATGYEFQVRAITLVNAAEVVGLTTNATAATTFALPSTPREVTATASFNGTPSVIISWRAPQSSGGSAITGFTVTLNPGGATCAAAANATSCEITGLTAGTAYSATVVAITAVGASVASAAASVTTINVAGAASIASVSGNNDSGSALISITAAQTDGGSAITSYLVQAFAGANATAFSCVVVPTGAGPYSCTVTGLNYKTDYNFKVIARNLAGNSAASEPSSVINLSRSQTIDFATPADITFGSRTVSLAGSASSGLDLSYTSSTTDVCTVSGEIVTVLKAGTCTITAAQTGANSPFAAADSVTRSFAISATAPAAPTLISVTPGASALTVNFTQVTDLGGSTHGGYVVSWARNPDFSDEQSATVAANATSFEITGLVANATYSVRIKTITAAVAAGSNWSNILQGGTFGAPAEPTDVVAVAGINGTPTPGAVTVSWTASATTGGTPITGYRVQAMEGVAVPAVGKTCTTSGTSCVVTGLDGARFYFFEVVAINAVGESEPGVDETEIRPGASQTITATDLTVESRRKRIDLGAFADSGLPLGYSVVSQTKTDPDRVGNVCSVSTSGVVSVNAAGSCVIEITQAGLDAFGNPSAYLPATAVQVTVTVTASDPSNAKNLTISSGDGQLELTWVAPDDDGGRPIVGYEVTWFTKGSPKTDAELITANAIDAGRVEVLTSTHIISGLQNGREYTIIVKPINADRRKGPTS